MYWHFKQLKSLNNRLSLTISQFQGFIPAFEPTHTPTFYEPEKSKISAREDVIDGRRGENVLSSFWQFVCWTLFCFVCFEGDTCIEVKQHHHLCHRSSHKCQMWNIPTLRIKYDEYFRWYCYEVLWPPYGHKTIWKCQWVTDLMTNKACCVDRCCQKVRKFLDSFSMKLLRMMKVCFLP